MRKFGCAALFAASFIAAPAASAGDFFITGQWGQIQLEGSDFDDDQNTLMQAGGCYRWGLGMAQVGLELGLGKLDEQDDHTRTDYPGGFIDRSVTLSSRYATIGANARIKPPAIPVYFVGRAGYLGLERKLDETAIDQYLDTAPVTQHRSFEETDGGTYLGVGVGTTLLPLLDVGLMYNQYRYSQVEYDPLNDEYELSEEMRNARSVSLSVEYRF